MTNRDVYAGALSLTGERAATEAADYEERAIVLLPMITASLAPLNRAIKVRRGDEEDVQDEFPTMPPEPDAWEPYCSLDSDWPLEPEFYACAAHYLAAALVAYEDEALAEYLSSRADVLRALLEESLPARVKPVTKK